MFAQRAARLACLLVSFIMLQLNKSIKHFNQSGPGELVKNKKYGEGRIFRAAPIQLGSSFRVSTLCYLISSPLFSFPRVTKKITTSAH